MNQIKNNALCLLIAGSVGFACQEAQAQSLVPVSPETVEKTTKELIYVDGAFYPGYDKENSYFHEGLWKPRTIPAGMSLPEFLGSKGDAALTQEELEELLYRFDELSTPSDLVNLLGTELVEDPEQMAMLQQALAQRMTGERPPGWGPDDKQDALRAFFDEAVSRNDNGNYLSLMDFKDVDMTGAALDHQDLRGANVTGAQISQANSLTHAILDELNLEGANFAGKNVTGVSIKSPENWDGSALNGATGLGGIVVNDTDMTGFNPATIPNAMDAWGAGGWSVGANFDNTTWSPTALDWMFNQPSSAQTIIRNASFDGVDMSGVQIVSDLLWVDFTGVTGVTGANFPPGDRWIVEMNMADLDMTDFPWESMAFRGTDLRQVRNMSGEDLNRIRGFGTHEGSQTNLSGRNLTGWAPTYSIVNANLSNATGITAASLANATDLRGIILTGTGITEGALIGALVAAGKNPNLPQYNVSSITF